MESKVLQYEFQVIKPIQLEKGKDIVGHASSSVTVSNLEKEVERLKKMIKELEKTKSERKPNVRSKRSSRSRR